MATFYEITQKHPCFAQGAKPNKGRIHLPVSPGCNIACKFCRRVVGNAPLSRPGVARSIITPQEALEAVRKAVWLTPDITVAGVAGPGDSLATPYALETFWLIKREFPEIIACMSTNGLMLPEKADEILEVGVDTLTVTVNAVDPHILAQIIEGVNPETLIQSQLSGISKLSAAGVMVKVNTVLLPEINAAHIETIAKAVSEAGAVMYNIIPLIPQEKLAWCSAPTCEQVSLARAAAENYIKVFRCCARCRADAAGVPGGEDISGSVYSVPLSVPNTFSHG
jgi:nitrogen fixation protein NifB